MLAVFEFFPAQSQEPIMCHWPPDPRTPRMPVWDTSRSESQTDLHPNQVWIQFGQLQARYSWQSCLSSKSSCALQRVNRMIRVVQPCKAMGRWSMLQVSWFPFQVFHQQSKYYSVQIHDSAGWLSKMKLSKGYTSPGVASSEKVRPLSGRSQ